MLFCAVERIDRLLFEAEDQHGPGGNTAAAVDRTTVGCITLALARNPPVFYLPLPDKAYGLLFGLFQAPYPKRFSGMFFVCSAHFNLYRQLTCRQTPTTV